MYCPGCPVRQQLGGGQGLRAFFRPLCVCSLQVMIERCLMHPLLRPIVLIAFLFCTYLARITPAKDCQCKQLRIAYICDIATLFLTPSFPPSPIRSKSLSFWQRFHECDTCREAGHPTSQQCHDTLPKHAASACTWWLNCLCLQQLLRRQAQHVRCRDLTSALCSLGLQVHCGGACVFSLPEEGAHFQAHTQGRPRAGLLDGPW